jgi:DNA-binding NarL/FixJ family response regulator
MQKVFIVEDSPPVLERLISLLGTLPDTHIVGHAAHAEEAVRAILAVRPDLVVLDLRLAQGTGFDVLIELHGKAPGIDVYMLSSFSYAAYSEMERPRDAVAERGAQHK